MLRFVGFAIAASAFAASVMFATTPWRVHGGRFVTEYLLLGGAVGLVGLVALAATLKWA
jgi:hypothetical protein